MRTVSVETDSNEDLSGVIEKDDDAPSPSNLLEKERMLFTKYGQRTQNF